jgi:hypothetical protein
MAQAYDNARELASVLEELAARSVSDQVRAVQRYRDLLEQVATGQIDAGAVRAQYDRLISEQSTQLARDVGELSLRFYQSIIDLNRAYLDRLFDQLGMASREPVVDGGQSPPVAAEPPSAAELRLRGRVGDTVDASFVVENKRAEPADVVFLLSEFTSAAGEPFRAALELDPPRFRLEGHEERPVALRLALDAALFTPGQEYRAEMLVRANDDLLLRLAIEVEE